MASFRLCFTASLSIGRLRQQDQHPHPFLIQRELCTMHRAEAQVNRHTPRDAKAVQVLGRKAFSTLSPKDRTIVVQGQPPLRCTAMIFHRGHAHVPSPERNRKLCRLPAHWRDTSRPRADREIALHATAAPNARLGHFEPRRPQRRWVARPARCVIRFTEMGTVITPKPCPLPATFGKTRLQRRAFRPRVPRPDTLPLAATAASRLSNADAERFGGRIGHP